MHSSAYPFVVIPNRKNWQVWLTSVWISYTQQQCEWENGLLGDCWDSCSLSLSPPWFMQIMRLLVTSSFFCSRLYFAALRFHQTVVQAIHFPVTLGFATVWPSLLLHRIPELSRSWMMCSRPQYESTPRFRPPKPGCWWLGTAQPISWQSFSWWPCNVGPEQHCGEAKREARS